MTLKRWQADLALGLAGLIWGFGFVAQKDALDYIGPFTFVAARFLLSALVVLPLVFLGGDAARAKKACREKPNRKKIVILCIAFAAAVSLQQYGLTATKVTNAAFITGLYVVMVPFIGLVLYRHKVSVPLAIACFLSVVGVWLLSGGSGANISFGRGDALILLCALGYAIQVVVMGQLVGHMRAPYTLSFLQYFVAGILALIAALSFEHIDFKAINDAWISIIYAGIASGGVAYTLQSVAQQHTPAADTAIILSSEALFGGIGGVWLLHEKITAAGLWGCGAIMLAIVLVELGPRIKVGRKKKALA